MTATMKRKTGERAELRWRHSDSVGSVRAMWNGHRAKTRLEEDTSRKVYSCMPWWCAIDGLEESRRVPGTLPRTIFTRSPARKAEEAPRSAQSAKSTTPAQATSPALKPRSLENLDDEPLTLQEDDPSKVDWTRSFHGLSAEPFSKEAADTLQAPLDPQEVEIKPDGIIYLPEIKYRRILNKAFGPGGWGLAPRGETIVTEKSVTREYALVAHGRLVSIARGEQDYFSREGIPTAAEGCKSNAMMRCCKDLGVASELWDPRFIRKFKADHTREVFVEHQNTKRRTKIWVRKGDPVSYPFVELKK